MKDDLSTINQSANPSEDNSLKSEVYVYEFGNFWFDPSESTNKRLLKGKTPIWLGPKESCLLLLLIENNQQGLTKEELVKHLWPEACKTPKDFANLPEKQRKSYLGRLNQQVSHLNDKLGEKSIKPKERHYKLTLPIKQTPRSNYGRYDDIDFGQWCFHPQKGGRITFAFGIGVSLSILYLFLKRYLTDTDPVIVISLIQAGVIASAIVVSFYVFDLDDKRLNLARLREFVEKALRQFFRYWRFVYAFWLLFYFSLAAATYVKSQENGSARFYALNVAETFFNNCNSLATALCYVVLNNPTIYKKKDGQRIHWSTIVWIVGGISVLGFSAIEVFLFLNSARVAHYLRLADIISGFIAAVSLAFYVRLLQRTFLNTTPWLALAFYAYVVIQPFYFLVTHVIGEVWLIEFAMLFKCLLFLHVAYLFRAGRLVTSFDAVH